MEDTLLKREEILRIAHELNGATHEPFHPSYHAFAIETMAQFEEMSRHLRVVWIPGTITGTSGDLFREVNRGYLTIACDGSPMEKGHPLAVEMPQGVTLNCLFRAVHDYYGHCATRCPFETFEGELEAYQNHRKMYSSAAQAALFGETVAQLCHYYAFGDFVETQKCAILPERYWK